MLMNGMKQSILKKSSSCLSVTPTGNANADAANRAAASATQAQSKAGTSAPVAPASAKIVRFVGIDTNSSVDEKKSAESSSSKKLSVYGTSTFQLQQPSTSMLAANLKSFSSLNSSTFYKNKHKNNLKFIMNENEKKSSSQTGTNQPLIAPATTPLSRLGIDMNSAEGQHQQYLNNNSNSALNSRNMTTRNYYKNSTAVPFKQIGVFSTEDELSGAKNDPRTAPNQRNLTKADAPSRQRSYLTIDSVTKIADGSSAGSQKLSAQSLRRTPGNKCLSFEVKRFEREPF